jgi:hypothetical protein
MYQDRGWGDHRIHTLVTLAVGKETIICHILQVKYTVNDKAAHQIGYYSYLSPYSFVKACRLLIQLFDIDPPNGNQNSQIPSERGFGSRGLQFVIIFSG